MRWFLIIFLLSLSLLVPRARVNGQASAASPAVEVTPSPTPPSAFSLIELPAQVDATAASVRLADSRLSMAASAMAAIRDLPTLGNEITASYKESSKVLASNPSMNTLQSLDFNWSATQRQLTEWMNSLTNGGLDLLTTEQNLAALKTKWQQTLDGLKSLDTGADVARRIQSLIASINKSQAQLQLRATTLGTLQNRIQIQQARVEEVLDAIHEAQKLGFNQLFQQDSPRIWERAAFSQGDEASQTQGLASELVQKSRDSIATQWEEVRAYSARHHWSFAIHAGLIGALVLLLGWMKGQLQKWCAEEAVLQTSAPVFATPLATAIVVSLMFWPVLYPTSPRLFGAILGCLGSIPVIYIMRRLTTASAWRVLNALAIFYPLGLLTTVTASLPVLTRGVFLLKTLAAVLFCLWYLRTTANQRAGPDFGRLRLGVRIGLIMMGVSLVSNILGYVHLSQLLASGLLWSAYIAMVMKASVTVGDALVAVLLHIKPLKNLQLVRNHRTLLLIRFYRLARLAAILFWLSTTLGIFFVRRPLYEAFQILLAQTWKLGGSDISLQGIAEFFLSIFGAWLLSKVIRFLLAEEVFPHAHLARGVPYAISTILHYLLLLGGFLIGVSKLGYDMTKITILAGAFGVGLGFGLQNVVSNFASGLILLFERPMQIGDVIEFGNVTGTVTNIGIRASIVRTVNGAEVVVPNGKLISDSFINWTLTNRQRVVEIPIGVAQFHNPPPTPPPALDEQGVEIPPLPVEPLPVDPKIVMDLLTATARATNGVAERPAPEVFFTEFAPGGMRFSLRVWTADFEEWRQVNSELAIGIRDALTKADIAVL